MRVSIRTKIFVAFLFISLVLVGISAGSLYVNFTKMTEKRIIENVQATMLDNRDEFNKIVLQIQLMQNQIIFDKAFGAALKAKSNNEFELNENINKIIELFGYVIKFQFGADTNYNSYNLFINESLPISKPLLQGNRCTFVNSATTNMSIYSCNGLENETWYQELLKNDGSIYTFTNDKNENYIYLARMINNEFKKHNDEPDFLGLSVVGIDLVKVLNKYRKSKLTDDMVVAALYENKIVCKTSDDLNNDFIKQVADLKTVLMESDDSFEYEGYLVNIVKTNAGIKMISFIPRKNIKLEMLEMRGFFLTILTITLLMMVMLSLFLSNRLTRPIKSLSETMRTANDKDIINLRMDVRSKDEVGELYNSFNHLMRKVENLMIKIESQNKHAREIEMKMFQMQISPHFLYNALDSISWMGMIHSQKEIVEMVKALSDIFKYSIKDGKTLAPLCEEVDCVHNYIKLQRSRYEDKIDLDINVDQELFDFMVPKCILQPLVENSIIHNIDEVEDKIEIRVFAKRIDGMIEFGVEDNGTNCDVCTLNNLLSGEETVLAKDKMGIRNVSERVKLQFGNGSKLKFQKTANGNTVAIIIINL